MEGQSSCSSPIEVDEDMDYVSTVRSVKSEPNPATLWNFHGCKLCRYKTKSYFIMKSHLRRHRVTRTSKVFNCSTSFIERYKCSSCDFKTSVLVNFNKHVEVSHRKLLEIKVENEEREDDTFIFGNFNLLNNTIPLKTYGCESCNFKTYSKLLYINHYTRCPLNDFINGNSSFRRRNSHKEFLRWHKYHNRPKYMGVAWFQCTKCPYKAKRQTTLDGHVRTSHFAPKYRFFKRVKKVRPQPPKLIKVHMCDDCDYSTSQLRSLRNHIISRHTPFDEINWFKCEECPYKTKWRQNLYSHIQCMHNVRRFFCEQCPYNAKQKRFLEAHVLVNHPDNTWEKVKTLAKQNSKFACPECDFVTETRIAVMNHVYFKHSQVVTKDMKKCQHCNYWSVNEAKFKKHALYCHTPKLHECKQCEFKSTKSRDLRGHMEKHRMQLQTLRVEIAPVKLYECGQCEFKSPKSRDLRGHMEKHGMQPQTLRCEICMFKSMQVADLQQHILTMHVAKQTVVCFNCQLCLFKTMEEKELKEHVFKMHVDPQNTNWFYCEMCSYKCRQQSELKNHILEKHIL